MTLISQYFCLCHFSAGIVGVCHYMAPNWFVFLSVQSNRFLKIFLSTDIIVLCSYSHPSYFVHFLCRFWCRYVLMWTFNFLSYEICMSCWKPSRILETKIKTALSMSRFHILSKNAQERSPWRPEQNAQRVGSPTTPPSLFIRDWPGIQECGGDDTVSEGATLVWKLVE